MHNLWNEDDGCAGIDSGNDDVRRLRLESRLRYVQCIGSASKTREIHLSARRRLERLVRCRTKQLYRSIRYIGAITLSNIHNECARRIGCHIDLCELRSAGREVFRLRRAHLRSLVSAHRRRVYGVRIPLYRRNTNTSCPITRTCRIVFIDGRTIPDRLKTSHRYG